MSAAQPTTAAVAAGVTPSVTMTGSTPTRAAAIVGATSADSLLSASATPAHTAPLSQPEKRAPESASPELHLPRVEVHLAPINVPSMVTSISAAPSVDSIVRSATERQRASDTGRTGTGDRVAVVTPAQVDKAQVDRAEVDKADVDIATTPAKIIGRPPEPRFPDALLHSKQREGLVIVRFMVNEFGRVDVASMIVERSDHELFTAAVRDILPRFRFEPARTRAPESKPVARWVSVPFRFTTTKK
jgi:protein TonB